MKFFKFLCHAFIATLIAYQTTCSALSHNDNPRANTSFDHSPKGVINVLGWHGYLSSPEIISMLKNRCGVEVSYDEYYGTSECYKRLNKTERVSYYDIIIFPNDAYEMIKNLVELKKSDLNGVVKNYSPEIRNKYLARSYSNNIVYFLFPILGFIYNPNILKIENTDSISTMFKKAKNNIVIINNDYIGVWNIAKDGQDSPTRKLVDRFKKMSRDADIYITNGYNNIYKRDDFAFAFQRSGDAVVTIKNTKNNRLLFLIHPKHSYLTPDLLAELNDRPETRCAARVLASKKALEIIQKETYYLSPYETYNSVEDPIFKEVYKDFINGSYKPTWLDPFFKKKIDWLLELQNMWEKIHLLPQVIKNKSLVLKNKAD